MTANYGCPQDATYGELFGNDTMTYGDFCAPVKAIVITPPTPVTVPGSGDYHPPEVRWLTGTVPVKAPRIVSVGSYALVLPFQSHPAPKPLVTPLPAVCDHWNDEQDLADILHALGMD